MRSIALAIRHRMRLSRGYLALTLLVLAIEVFIALEVNDAFVRPFVGDTLAVVLVYTALLSLFDLAHMKAALVAFGIACAIELGQYLDLVDRLGLAHFALARIVLGTFFDPRDLLAYAAGAALALIAERVCKSRA